MEIIVEGKGTKFITPDEVVITLTFTTKGISYEEVLSLGSQNVQSFIDNLLKPNGFNADDMKTRSFTIKEETKYNEITKNYDFVGYSYNQSATIKFDYDKNKMAKMMDEISKLDNPPKYQINFGIKDENACKEEILDLAYKDAERQALAIAKSAGKVLNRCAKVDFKPFTTEYFSTSNLDSRFMYERETVFGAAPTIVNIFTPEDIELTEHLYCLWIAE